MKVIVLGAGVVGINTAWHLASQGAEVIVLEQHEGPALETSFANAGQISPGYAAPWAAPGVPLKAIKWMFEKHAPLAIRPDGSLFQLQWMFAMLRNCTQAAYAVNKGRMVRLAEYSRDVLKQMRADIGIRYEHREGGTLQAFRTQAQLDDVAKDVEVLRQTGVPFELLDAQGCARAEPALAAVAHKIKGGLRLPNDETGDCFLYTNRLADMTRERGARFEFGVSITDLIRDGDRVNGVRYVRNGEPVELKADAVVMALGCASTAFARRLDLPLPVYPVKGYSITVPIVDAAKAPVSTVLDESYKVAITRFDERIRVGGMAELSGHDKTLRPVRRETLEMVVNDLFPGAGDTARATFWTGLRPMTPDGTPVVGPTPYRGLWINTGHGTLGWTMGPGSGKLLADQILGRTPEISTEGLSIDRYLSGGRVRVSAQPARA